MHAFPSRFGAFTAWFLLIAAAASAQTLDFGDAPNIYSTTLASDGARHTATGPRLGANRDTEADGQPNTSATGDDNAGAPDDEDGVVFSPQLMAGGFSTFGVVASAAGKLDAWIDFNRDGDWADAGEQIAVGVAVEAGARLVDFRVPDDLLLTPGATAQTAARVRLSTAGGLAPTGAAADGEVEDYAVTLAAPASASNVRAWYAAGQVFVVWDYDTAMAPETFEIYASTGAFTSTTAPGVARVGRLFEVECSGVDLVEEMRAAYGAANAPTGFLIPDGSGGTVRLASGQGLFVATVRANANRFFAVVPRGRTSVTAGERTASAVNEIFSLAQAPRYHTQSTINVLGQPVSFHVVWIDGDDNDAAGRPDFPLMGNSARAGIPRLFMSVLPAGGLSGAGPHPSSLLFHGGESRAGMWVPGGAAVRNVGLDAFPGALIALEDQVYRISAGTPTQDTTMWFGWVPTWDPFLEAGLPANNAVVRNYTQRWINWTLDWLLGQPAFNLDAQHVSAHGHSRGSAGLMHFSRSHPTRFSSVSLFDTPLAADGNKPTIVNMLGTSAQNLATTQLRYDGQPVHFTDILDLRDLPVLPRDLPFTRLESGQREHFWVDDYDHDHEPDMQVMLRETDALGIAPVYYWDLREHGLELMTYDAMVAALGAAKPADWTSVDYWSPTIATQMRRDDGTAQTRYRADQSYPHFFNFQQHTGHGDFGTCTYPNHQGTYFVQSEPGYLGELTAEDQIPPRSGGQDRGTWGGWHEWDPASIVDNTSRWECVLWLVDAQIDTALGPTELCPVQRLTADFALRKPQNFKPTVGRALLWQVTDAATGATFQSGVTRVGDGDLVTIRDVTVRRDPARVRLSIFTTGAVGTPAIGAITGALSAVAGGQINLSAIASGAGPFTYQWMFNGVVIPGANESSYRVASAQSFNTGDYTVVVTNAAGSSVSQSANVTVAAPAVGGRLANLSTRGFVGVGDAVMIPGIVIDAGGSARLLIRAVGPTLGGFGVAGTLDDPVLTLYSGQTALTSNDDWTLAPDALTTQQVAAQVFAFPLGVDSKDAAMVVTLPPGTYTAVATGKNGATGIVLVEVYLVP